MFFYKNLCVLCDLCGKRLRFEVTVMPIYEFHCNDCSRNFELLLFGKEKPSCPSCSSKKVSRLMSACGFMSKGSGGETVKSSAADSSCSGCTATSCSTCGH